MKIFIFILTIFFNLEALAQQLSLKPDGMQKIIMGKDEITKKDYDEFWQSLEAKNDKDKINIINSMKKNYLPLQKYQKESWACAKTAWKLRKKIACPKAESIASNYKKENGVEFPPMVKEMSDSIIEGAANRKTVSLLKDVPAMPVTLELILQSEKGLANSVKRLEKVLTTEFKQ